MILVICEPEDICGLWLVNEIRRRGREVEHVLPDELAIGSRLSLHVSSQHDLAEAELADGRRIIGSDLIGVINRMTSFPRPVFDGISDRDVVYIGEELRAAVVAWFAGLPCPVLNRPTPYSAPGLVMHESSWRRYAMMLGIETATLKLDANGFEIQPANFSVAVIGNKVFATEENTVQASISDASKRLARALGIRLLGVDFNVSTTGEWEFLRAHTLPDVMLFGTDTVDAFLTEMEGQ